MDVNIILGTLLIIFILSVATSFLSLIYDTYRIREISLLVAVVSATAMTIIIVVSKLFLNIEI